MVGQQDLSGHQMGQEQLDVSQALLGMTITPEAAAQRLDEVAKKVIQR